jgi:hypothetical protein
MENLQVSKTQTKSYEMCSQQHLSAISAPGRMCMEVCMLGGDEYKTVPEIFMQ